MSFWVLKGELQRTHKYSTLFPLELNHVLWPNNQQTCVCQPRFSCFGRNIKYSTAFWFFSEWEWWAMTCPDITHELQIRFTKREEQSCKSQPRWSSWTTFHHRYFKSYIYANFTVDLQSYQTMTLNQCLPKYRAVIFIIWFKPPQKVGLWGESILKESWLKCSVSTFRNDIINPSRVCINTNSTLNTGHLHFWDNLSRGKPKDSNWKSKISHISLSTHDLHHHRHPKLLPTPFFFFYSRSYSFRHTGYTTYLKSIALHTKRLIQYGGLNFEP